MAAVIDFSTARTVGDTPISTGTRATGTQAVGPRLRVIQGGRSPAALRLRRTYLRRRLAVAAVAVVLLVLAVRTVAAVGASAAAVPPAVGTGATHVVHAGDTMWSIAARVAPGVDRRVAVDQLMAANGGTAALRVGQVVLVPSSLRSGG